MPRKRSPNPINEAHEVCSIASDLENRAWKILLKSVKGSELRNIKCLPDNKLEFQFQLFEIMVAETFCWLADGMDWVVTQIRGDAGVDFEGIKEGIIVAGITTLPGILIYGQVKRRSQKTVDLKAADEIGSMLTHYQNSRQQNHLTLHSILYVISSPNFNQMEKAMLHSMEQCYLLKTLIVKPRILDGDKFILFWALLKNSFLASVENALSPEERKTLNCFLDSYRNKAANLLHIDFEMKEPYTTGCFVSIEITVSSTFDFSGIKLGIRWRRHREEQNLIELISPSIVASKIGKVLILEDERPVQILLRFRCFVENNVRLGIVELLDEHGEAIKALDLGETRFKPKFDVPYLRTPNIESWNKAVNQLDQVKLRDISALAIIGSGGSGKTRFCEELIDYAENHNFSCIRFGHPLDTVSTHKVIRDLMRELSISKTGDAVRFIEDTLLELKKIADVKSETWETSVALFLAGETNYELDDIVKCLFTLMIVKARSFPLLIYIHDMHWARNAELNVFESLLESMIRNRATFRNGVIFLFEGRNREPIRIDDRDNVPTEWFDFITNRLVSTIEIRAWDEKESVEFLTNVFEQGIDKSRYVSAGAMPLHDELMNALIQNAKGNPMHLVEQIKYFIDIGAVRRNQTNGMLYLIEPVARYFDTPSDIAGLINQRIAFYRMRYPQHVKALTLLSKISRKIPLPLFRHVITQLGIVDDDIFNTMDVVHIPTNAEGAVEFNHENYARTFSSTVESYEPILLCMILDWFHKSMAETPESILLMVRVHFLFSDISYQHANNLILRGLDLSQTSLEMREAFFRYMIRIPEPVLSATKYSLSSIQFDLSQILAKIGDWEEALEMLRKVVRTWERNCNDSTVKMRLRSQIVIAELANDLQRPDDSIAEIDKAIESLQSTVDESHYLELLEELWNRKGNSYWFNGQISEGIKWHFKAYRSATVSGNKWRRAMALRELGTLYLHVDVRIGIRILAKSLWNMLGTDEPNNIERDVIEIQLLMGKILQHENVDRNICEGYRRQGKELFLTVNNINKCNYSATLCSLINGVIDILRGDYEQAEFWFRLGITKAIQGRQYDLLWKARLNLAQLIFPQKPWEACVHAQEAVSIIINPFERLKHPYCEHRKSLMKLPIMHAYRIIMIADPSNAMMGDLVYGLYGEVPDFSKWGTRPKCTAGLDDAQQVLHVRLDDNDFFTMN